MKLAYLIRDNCHDEILGAATSYDRALSYAFTYLLQYNSQKEALEELKNMQDEDYCEDTQLSIIDVPFIE